MQLITGSALSGAWQEKHFDFLTANGLSPTEQMDFTALLTDEDDVIAAGSLDGYTLKCLAVSPLYQGEDLLSRIMTALLQEAMARGYDKLMLYTKPLNRSRFAPFGFYPLVRTRDCLVMENRRTGLTDFLNAVKVPCAVGPVGAIVANCNPFTLGHQYLMEQAAKDTGTLHVFVLSEDKGLFSPHERLEIAKKGLAHLSNVHVHGTDAYMVSSATFPTYFIKDREKAAQVYCESDITLFGEKIAPALSITRRYVGTEPHSPVTNCYNETMKQLLPHYGIDVIEMDRMEKDGCAVSASRVRELMKTGDIDAISRLVPQTTMPYILKKLGGT